MSTSTSSDEYFLWFSDIHYDPYYATKDAYKAGYNANAVCNSTSIPSMGNIGCDSPKALVDSALDYASEVAASPSFIILSGDSIRHGVDMLYTSNNHEGSENRVGSEVNKAAHSAYHIDAMNKVGEIINDLLAIIVEVFPDVEIIFSLGNNDVVPDYYLRLEGGVASNFGNSTLTPEDSGMLGIIYNALIDNIDDSSENNQAERRVQSLLSAEDSTTFLKGGYYSRKLPNGFTILSINTVLYSSLFGPEPLNANDPGEQFSWMRQTLANIRERGAQAIIVGHIPPSVGSFRHNQLWKEKYIISYYEIIQQFDDVITGQLFGHLHTEEFRVGVGKMGKSAIPSSISTPLLLAGSLTPIHGNNPSFRKVFFGDDEGDDNQYRILDYESYCHSMNSENDTEDWSKLYTFSETYGAVTDEIKTEGLSANVFRSILQSMNDEQGEMSSTMNSFLSFVRSGSDGDVESSNTDNDCDVNCRDEWMCTLSGATTIKQYHICMLQKKGSSRTIISVAGAALFCAAVLFIMAVRLRKRRLRAQYETTSSIDGTVEMDDQMI